MNRPDDPPAPPLDALRQPVPFAPALPAAPAGREGRSGTVSLLDAARVALRESRTEAADLAARLSRAEAERAAAQEQAEALSRRARDYVRKADECVAAALRRVVQIENENRFLLDLAGGSREPHLSGVAAP